MAFLYWIANVLTLALIVWIILSYVVVFGRVAWDHPIRRLYEFFNGFIDPLLRPIRAVVPPVRVGGAALDLSPIVLLLVIRFVPVIVDAFI
ncbi:MAG: YggT family protein [Acidimicrobiia bacterium]